MNPADERVWKIINNTDNNTTNQTPTKTIILQVPEVPDDQVVPLPAEELLT